MSVLENEQVDRSYSGGTRKVRDLLFVYYEMVDHPMSDKPVAVERTARRNQEIDVSALELYGRLELGERLHSFYDDDEMEALEKGQVNQETGLPVVSDADAELLSNSEEWGVGEFADYILEHKPNVADTVALAKDDPSAARRLLEAEGQANGSAGPRQGVVSGLEKIINEG